MTKNPEYNRLLKKWGCNEATCECCGKDVAGKDVIETETDWRCVDCAKKPDNLEPFEIRERAQMGIFY